MERIFGKNHNFQCPNGPIIHENHEDQRGWWHITDKELFSDAKLNLENLPKTVHGHYDVIVVCIYKM